MLINQLAPALVLLGGLSWTVISSPSPPNALAHQARDLNKHSPAGRNGAWFGWGANFYNNRWASSAKVDAENVASLHSTCQKDYTVGVSTAPLVVNGVSYFPTWGGLLVALDYSRCEVIWQTNITDIILAYKQIPSDFLTVTLSLARTTPAIQGNVLFLGTLANALLLAVDKRRGKLIDKIQINDHPAAIVTMSPTLLIAGYQCCSFIGNMQGIAFEHKRFRLLWNQNTIPAGANFSGAAIWGSQPPIDPFRHQVFAATGNVYSVPDSYTACQNQTGNQTSTSAVNITDPCAPGVYQEAVLAFDAFTGNINWVHVLSPVDAWVSACLDTATPNFGACPPNAGPDADFGMAPSFVPSSAITPSNKDTLVIGQKNGNLYALSAAAGELYWALATSPDGTLGGLIWGVAVDASAVYYTAVNFLRKPWQLQDGTKLANGAFGAASLREGKIIWETQIPRNSTSLVAPTVVNDIVMVGVGGAYNASNAFQATAPGSLLALDKHTGAIIKESLLDQYFQGGIAVVHDHVLFGTGYNGRTNGSFNVWKLDD